MSEEPLLPSSGSMEIPKASILPRTVSSKGGFLRMGSKVGLPISIWQVAPVAMAPASTHFFTFSSTLPMAWSQPFCGRLSTGQHYLIANSQEVDRTLLYIAVTAQDGLARLFLAPAYRRTRVFCDAGIRHLFTGQTAHVIL